MTNLLNKILSSLMSSDKYSTSIINSINTILNQNQPSGNQILSVVGNEIENMSKNLIEAFTEKI